MKLYFNIIMISCVLILISSATSCKHEHGDKTHTHNPDGSIDKSGPEWTSDYICPMHCKGSGSAEEGTCPVCKMNLVPNKDKKMNADHSGHDHNGHDHSGHDHDHGDHSGHDH